MAHLFTVQDLVDRGLTAFWQCMSCRAMGDVDLPRLAAVLGPGATLVNRHPPCRRCAGGRVFFYVRAGLAVQRQTTREADRQALRDDAAAVARELRARGFRRVEGRWVAPDTPASAPAAGAASACRSSSRTSDT